LGIIKKLASQTAVYGVSTIAGRLLNYLLVPLYTRIFQPAEYGTITELYAYAGFFTVIFTYGMETAFFRFSQKYPRSEKVYTTAFISILITTVVLSGSLAVFAPLWSRLLHYESNSEYIVWFALILGLDALTAIPFASLRQQNKPVAFATLKITNILANVGFNIFFLLICPKLAATHSLIQSIYKPDMGVGYVFIANLLASALTFLLLLPQVLKKHFSFSFSLWAQMLRYAMPLLVVGLAGITDEMLGRALLKWLLPYDAEENLRQLGIYGANYKLAVLIALFTQAYRFAAEPLFFAESSKQNSKESYARMMKFYMLVQCVFFLVITLYIELFKRFIGSDYHEGLHVVPVLLLANIALGVYYNLSIWYKITDNTHLGAFISVSGAALTIVLNVLLIPILGYYGSAWATLICYTSISVASWWLSKKYFPLDYDWYHLLLYLVVAIILYFIAFNVRKFFGLPVYFSLAFNTLLLILYLWWLWNAEWKGNLNFKAK
jgi:O-antigen/teichoic acid export membrane protein